MSRVRTTKSETRSLSLPKNKTGLFAADTIHEVKSTRKHSITVPTLSPQFRNNCSANSLLASSEQNHHQLQQYRLSNNEIQQYYPLDGNNNSFVDSSNDSRMTLNGIRNGFRPSLVRHQKLRLTTASTSRTNNPSENKEFPPRSTIVQSHTLARLRSEIDHINHKLNKHKESSKTLRLQNNRELNASPNSTISYTPTYRDSSARSTLTADRIHQRFSSAITHGTGRTRVTGPTMNNTSDQLHKHFRMLLHHHHHQLLGIDDNQQDTTIDYRPTHAYQVPQQSNVGSDSIFLKDSPLNSSMKTHSTKKDRHHNYFKSISCPFYVMYFTNLAMQQQDNKDNNPNNNENDIRILNMSSKMSKVSASTHPSTVNPKRHSIRRTVNSPISIYTYSTMDDDDGYMTNSTSITHKKRLSTKISTSEKETLQDILRTSSINRVKV